MIEVAPLVGYKALSAFYSFQVLMIGLKMLPFYQDQAPEEFFDRFRDLEEHEKEKFVRLAVASVPLKKDEVEAIVCLAKDKNGVPYSAINLGNLELLELQEIMVAVCMALGRIKVPFVSDEEKKKRSEPGALISTANT